MSSFVESFCQPTSSPLRRLTSPETKLTPPARAEMKCSSRLCARADAAARAVRKERAARQLSDVRKIFFVCVFMWAPLPSLRGTSGRVFRVSVASILPRARHGKGFLKKTRVYSFLGLKRVGLTAAGAEFAEGAQRLEHTHLSAQSQRPLRLCGELSRTPNSRMNKLRKKTEGGTGQTNSPPRA